MHAKHVRIIYTPKNVFTYQYHEFSILFGILFICTFMRPGSAATPFYLVDLLFSKPMSMSHVLFLGERKEGCSAECGVSIYPFLDLQVSHLVYMFFCTSSPVSWFHFFPIVINL